MTAALRVLAPGLMTTVQDLGRPGLQHVGIPTGGALDPVALRAANALVGNSPGAAALEVAYLGPTLAVDTDDARLSIAGADADIVVLSDASASSGERIKGNRSIRLRRGNAIRIGSLAGGAVLYVGVEGGFDIAPVLGSASTYVRGAFGGWEGRPLAAGDCLPLRCEQASARSDLKLDGLDFFPPRTIRAIPGPQADYFSDDEIEAFFGTEFTVSAGSDRMGMRLSGRTIRHARGFDIVSDAVPPGAIQIPGNGQPIVLLADRQTTGGYPKIATVISADLPAIGRLPIGARVRFARVSVEQAVAARRAHLATIEQIVHKIKPLKYTPEEMTRRLADNNLIDGVVGAVA